MWARPETVAVPTPRPQPRPARVPSPTAQRSIPPPHLPAPSARQPPGPAVPALLTGGSRSRCPGSRRPARGSRAAAGLRPGRGTGSRWPAPTRRGSSTPRAGGEPASSCAAARGDPEPGRQDRPDRTRGPRREQSERAGERAEPGYELGVSGGAPTPLQGRLFKFGEVGSAPSKGAWGFFINPRRSGADEVAAAAELGVRGSRVPGRPDLVAASSPAHSRTFPIKPSSGPQTPVGHPLHDWLFHLDEIPTTLPSIRWHRSHFSEVETEAQES